MRLRSLLFVPGDRPERFEKAADSGADAIILDLEDSVSLANKGSARKAVAEYLAGERSTFTLVRVNPLDSHMTAADISAILPALPDAIMLPKADGAPSIAQLDMIWRSEGGDADHLPPVLPIATETPQAIFTLGSYREISDRLLGLTWGAEDLPAAIGASASREEDGRYTPPYQLARSLTLFAAHATGTAAIDTVFPAIKDMDGLKRYAELARRDGFTGMMAIHPAQVEAINAAFTPSAEEVARAHAILEAFNANPDAGVLQIDGKMIDAPHIKQARHILSMAD
jgi:citrate lyase subunit beta/citryl-CoA lyase